MIGETISHYQITEKLDEAGGSVVSRRLSTAWVWLTVLLLLGVVALAGARREELPPARDGTLELRGIQQYYRIYGSGPPLLLLHGLTNTWRVWRPFLPSLAADHMLIVPDLRGHGRTTNTASELKPSQVAQDMFALLDSLKIDRVNVAGLSFGGHVALRMSIQQPSRIAAMISIAGAHRLPPASRKYCEENVNAPLKQGWWLDEVKTWHPRGEDQLREVRDLGLTGSLNDDFTMSDAALSTIRARTLIIQGDRDEIFPLEVPVELARKIGDSQLWIVPNAPHRVFFFCDFMPRNVSCGGGTEAATIFPGVVKKFIASGPR